MLYNCCCYTVYVLLENFVCKFRRKSRKQFYNTKQYYNYTQRHIGRFKFYENSGKLRSEYIYNRNINDGKYNNATKQRYFYG